MASSLLLLLDDIASVLDDVAALTKVATKKTAGVLGDDLALNAKQVSGVRPHRELPVVWAVARGSALNKAILVPVAVCASVFVPSAINYLLVIGGAYLCFEGAEKIIHSLQRYRKKRWSKQSSGSGSQQKGGGRVGSRVGESEQAASAEAVKISGAIRTDFILSAEIIVITLGVVSERTILEQVLVLTAISVTMTVGVYGLVACIVKLDDLGAWLVLRSNSALVFTGRLILNAAPWLMRLLAIAGTLAMFLVGGGIIGHAFPELHHQLIDIVVVSQHEEPDVSLWLTMSSMIVDGVIGFLLGLFIYAFLKGGLLCVKKVSGSQEKT